MNVDAGRPLAQASELLVLLTWQGPLLVLRVNEPDSSVLGVEVYDAGVPPAVYHFPPEIMKPFWVPF